MTGQGDDYTTRCFLGYQYFKDHYQIIELILAKKKELDADPRAIQQIEFYRRLRTNSKVCIILEKKKKQYQKFTKEHQKFLKNIKMV